MRTYISFKEHEKTTFEAGQISPEMASVLYTEYGDSIQIAPPSFTTNGLWELSSNGVVGFIPLPNDTVLNIIPKVAVGNIFTMLSYAYKLRSFRFLDGIVESETLKGFFDKLAIILTQMIIEREKKGLYRAYISKHESLRFVSGRIDLMQLVRKPVLDTISCIYEKRIPDIRENQVLLWTLHSILRSGVASDNTQDLMRKAYRMLSRSVSLKPFSGINAMCPTYHRLNADYHPMHCLCKFFLDHITPSHELGELKALPFLINMPRLFEMFVSEWLRIHLFKGLSLKTQVKHHIDQNRKISFNIDNVIYNDSDGKALCVLDTKYKLPTTPSPEDIAQIVAYAAAKECKDAILIFPSDATQSIDTALGGFRVRSLCFPLEGNLEDAGQEFLHSLSLPY